MKSLTLLLVFLFSVAVYSQATVDEKLNRFFQIYESGSSEAIEYLFEDNKWMENKFEEMLNLKYQLVELQKELGEYYGNEKLSELNLGESLKEVTYVVKYERMPLRFRFHFYKAKDNWMALNFYYDDNFPEEFLTAKGIE